MTDREDLKSIILSVPEETVGVGLVVAGVAGAFVTFLYDKEGDGEEEEGATGPPMMPLVLFLRRWR